jgi:predicted DNA-binding transcriptional regulator AlpA
MDAQIKNQKTISKKILKEKLRIKEDRTIEAYIKDGALPQPVKELKDGDLLFDKQEVLEILGAKSFEEDFIDAEDVSKMLNVGKGHVYSFVKKGMIPCYRLKNARGSQILYLRSEVEAAKQYTIRWSSAFANRLGKERGTKIIFAKLISEELGFLTSRASDIFREIMINDKTVVEVSKMFSLTPIRIMQLLEQAVKTLEIRLNSINKRIENVHKIDSELEVLRKKLDYYEAKEKQLFALPYEVQELLPKKLEDFYFSKRVLNTMNAADVFTIGDLVKYRKQDFLKFRGSGKLSAKEVTAFLESKGLTWNMKI